MTRSATTTRSVTANLPATTRSYVPPRAGARSSYARELGFSPLEVITGRLAGAAGRGVLAGDDLAGVFDPVPVAARDVDLVCAG
jgi:hypothetical protein